MIASSSPIPPPRPDDDEDVHWALSTASALWARGDAAESIKWLRRAAETASDQNRDLRSLELFKAAADATSLVGRPSAAPLPAPPAPARSNPPPNAPSRPPNGPTGTLSMQIPQGAAPGAGQSPTLPPARPSAAPMPPPQPTTSTSSPPARAPLPQRSSAPGAGPPAGTARAAAAQANANAQVARAGAAGFSSQRPAASPGATGPAARGVLKQTLPSEGAGPGSQPPRGPLPAARPSPGGGASPSSAAKRADARKRPLDDRFHFPDEEVTIQRDLAALKPRPVHTDLAADEAAAAAAATQRAPVVATPPVARTLISTLGGSAASATAFGVATKSAAEQADHAHTPLDDLDEQTSVLAGDEAELEFEGSATGETAAALLALIEQDHLEQHVRPGREGEDDEGVTGEEDSSDPRAGGLSAPSVRPDPIPPRPMVAIPIVRDDRANAWTAVRVIVRRDPGGLRIEPMARGARAAPGAVTAVLVAQDDAGAEALLKLLER